MADPTEADADLNERAQRMTRRRSYQELTIARDVIKDGAPAFARVERFRFGPEGGFAHAVDWVEIGVIIEGYGDHICARGSLPVRAGTVLAVRPGTWGQPVNCDLESAVIGISPATIATDLAFLRPWPGVRDLLYSSPRAVRGLLVLSVDPQDALAFADEVRDLARLLAEEPRDHVMVVGQLILALGLLARALPGSGSGGVMHPAVEATLRSLEAEPERAWRLDDLARAVNLDPAYLVRRFRTEVGTPPMAHLAQLRVERAAVLLAERNLSITQIGEAVGWPGSAHFSRRFRALMGVSPSRYREDLQRSQLA
jgi:AraC family L-rhamnose operon transcriptional activator RhaR